MPSPPLITALFFFLLLLLLLLRRRRPLFFPSFRSHWRSIQHFPYHALVEHLQESDSIYSMSGFKEKSGKWRWMESDKNRLLLLLRFLLILLPFNQFLVLRVEFDRRVLGGGGGGGRKEEIFPYHALTALCASDISGWRFSSKYRRITIAPSRWLVKSPFRLLSTPFPTEYKIKLHPPRRWHNSATLIIQLKRGTKKKRKKEGDNRIF